MNRWPPGITALAALAVATLPLTACAPSGESTCEGDNAPGSGDDTSAFVSVDSLGNTSVEDWMPVTSGNWPNGLTTDTCSDPNGPTCYDCLHAPTGTYARWFRVETQGDGYVDDDWFGATLGQLTFSDFDEETGSGLGTDGAYYAFDTVSACAPAYWLLRGR